MGEKNCNWFFEKHSGREKGPNDALEENFKTHPYYALVREAIQNSLDAVDNTEEPVIVKFDFIKLNRLEFPKLIDNLREHIILSKEYWKNNPDAVRKFDEMIKYLDGEEKNMKRLWITTLKVSDYNTIGMEYEPDDTNSTFYAFLLSEGNSSKNIVGSGGSFGFGKAAYFNLSPFRAVIVSTRNKKNKVVFEGATVLATHKKNDEKLTAYGFYNCEGGNIPVTNEDEIPDFFKRNEMGTDIYILGLWDKKDRKEEMIKSILNNFWLAIHNKKLIVEVDGDRIDKASLPKYIDDYYENEIEKGSVNDIKKWNPKPYYNAVRNYGLNENKYFLFEDNLEIAGKVKFYVYLNKKLPNRIAYFRKPQMLVYKQTNNKLDGYVGVFICEGEKGNEILKEMENPEHNEWKAENFKINPTQTSPIAIKIEKEIRDFINEKLKELSGINHSNQSAIRDLEEYLYIPGELIDNAEKFDLSGSNENMKKGEISTQNTEEETPLQTTTLKEPVRKNPVKRSPQYAVDKINGNMDDEGTMERILIGGNGGGGGGNKPGPDGNTISEEYINSDGTKKIRKPVEIKYRVIGSENKHYILFKSLYPIENAEIEIYIGTDNGEVKCDNIKKVSKGRIEGNKITDFNINPGKDILEIEFDDNILHSIKLKTYEIS